MSKESWPRNWDTLSLRCRHAESLCPTSGAIPLALHATSGRQPTFRPPRPTAARRLERAVCLLLELCPMQTTPADIVFACTHCTASYVVDASAAGMTIQCQGCNRSIAVPQPSSGSETRATSEPTGHLADLERRLKENESQRTEITSYINQHTIQLARWQLRLQTLEERRKELTAEIRSLS